MKLLTIMTIQWQKQIDTKVKQVFKTKKVDMIDLIKQICSLNYMWTHIGNFFSIPIQMMRKFIDASNFLSGVCLVFKFYKAWYLWENIQGENNHCFQKFETMQIKFSVFWNVEVLYV